MAIKALEKGLKEKKNYQILLGVTGSGKTFTMANVIAKVNKPTLVIAHNKTLAAQLAQEYRDFFPDNAVCYFVSYYDYYQPEAYIPTTDTYIEKDAAINEEIDRLRHQATQALLSRKDVIVVASVSCIYGLGSPTDYAEGYIHFEVGQKFNRTEFLKKLVNLQFTRTTAVLKPGTFRFLGNILEIMPPSVKEIIRLRISSDNLIDEITKEDEVSRVLIASLSNYILFPAKHFITSVDMRNKALKKIREELDEQVDKLVSKGKVLEAERLRRRTNYDLVMLEEVGYCQGIENYSRHLSGRRIGQAPDTLLSYFPRDKNGQPDFLTIIDESHVTVPQIAGMYAGDRARKKNLIDYGFRLPSALDNRPLNLKEFEKRVGPIIFTTATPGKYELDKDNKPIEQIIRPTGLIDPSIIVRPRTAKSNYEGQIKNFITEASKEIEKGGRVMATVLTKKMAEDLSDFLKKEGLKAEYLHSEIKTLERVKILSQFRQGSKNGGFDLLVGVNLLREGLDLPEVSLIGILDADSEGFLRSEVALIQTIGRAARNLAGRVILYADRMSPSMERAIGENERRRKKQLAYNKKNNITPRSIIKNIKDITENMMDKRRKIIKDELYLENIFKMNKGELKRLIKAKEKEMNEAVKILDFETAAILRDEIKVLVEIDAK
ncbi:MAG TPA: excinuclease ABC subunit UvrB [Candidatus Vogelbacteria bacterium]|nr:excinuclease ABC subunit UvrB [Candidatus Vogelbacteria bacterium]